MLRHYLVMARRGFVRHKLYSFINIAGLAVGLWRISIPVLVANLIAWPVAYFYLHHWLEGYAYRVPLNPLYFLASGGAALLIAWATVYAITLRPARTNPIHALRYE